MTLRHVRDINEGVHGSFGGGIAWLIPCFGKAWQSILSEGGDMLAASRDVARIGRGINLSRKVWRRSKQGPHQPVPALLVDFTVPQA